jgi:biotin synthase
MAETIRHDWTLREIDTLYHLPFPELIYRSATLHRQYHDPSTVQFCKLLSIKTGGCPEDCGYCPQSAHYPVAEVERGGLLESREILSAAEQARKDGATRFCMGAAWREPKDGAEFDQVLDDIRNVAATGMEVCVTLGLLTEKQAFRLKEAGLTAYNHNLDTSESYYPQIIGTRTYRDRIETIGHVIKAGISVCSGGIIGMGESVEDRMALLRQLSSFTPHPESVPVNLLIPFKGTPLEGARPVDPLDLVRMVATARMVMPASRIRLSAGRLLLSRETHALCFLAGANSIFVGNQLLTAPNPDGERDEALLAALGMRKDGVRE